MRISKACFASLTLLVVVFFLIYGVEMFFKVRGAFVDANQRLNRHVACSSRLSLVFQAGFLLFLGLKILLFQFFGFTEMNYSNLLARSLILKCTPKPNHTQSLGVPDPTNEFLKIYINNFE